MGRNERSGCGGPGEGGDSSGTTSQHESSSSSEESESSEDIHSDVDMEFLTAVRLSLQVSGRRERANRRDTQTESKRPNKRARTAISRNSTACETDQESSSNESSNYDDDTEQECTSNESVDRYNTPGDALLREVAAIRAEMLSTQ